MTAVSTRPRELSMPDREDPCPARRQGPDWLDVPFAEKTSQSGRGPVGPTAKRWHDPDPRRRAIPASCPMDRRAEVPTCCRERPNVRSGLFVDMVPESCWFTNVRTCVSQQDWERLRRMITRRAGHKCEICGATENRTVERRLRPTSGGLRRAQRRQALRRLICLCSPCHLSRTWAMPTSPTEPTKPRHLCDVAA